MVSRFPLLQKYNQHKVLNFYHAHTCATIRGEVISRGVYIYICNSYSGM